MVKIRSFKDLVVWKEAHKLLILMYRTTKVYPKHEQYSLVDQTRRASSSVTNNIAEGFGRQTYKEKIQFYYLSRGSLNELENQLLLAKEVGYIEDAKYQELLSQINYVQKLLQGLITKSKLILKT